MNKPFAPKPAPISYADGPRLERAMRTLPYEAQVRFLSAYKAHLESQVIQSLQRRGHLLYITMADGKDTRSEVFDFGVETHAQRCLAALTDCLRTNHAPAKVLMPEPPPAP